MKYSFLGAGLMVFGLFTLVIIIMFQSITMDNDSEYYVLKEAMKASMYESIDKEYGSNPENYITCTNNGKTYKTSKVKIVEQKFVENFTRRFQAGIGGDAQDYTIEFYDIVESPPKATVKITSKTGSYKAVLNSDDDISIVNNLTGILEMEETDCKES